MYPKAREPGANLCAQRRKTDWRSGRRGRAGANVSCLPGQPAKQELEQLFGRISETKAAIMACFRTSGIRFCEWRREKAVEMRLPLGKGRRFVHWGEPRTQTEGSDSLIEG